MSIIKKSKSTEPQLHIEMLDFLSEFSGLHKGTIQSIRYIDEKSSQQGYYTVSFIAKCADHRIPMDNLEGIGEFSWKVNKLAFKRYCEENPKIIR